MRKTVLDQGSHALPFKILYVGISRTIHFKVFGITRVDPKSADTVIINGAVEGEDASDFPSACLIYAPDKEKGQLVFLVDIKEELQSGPDKVELMNRFKMGRPASFYSKRNKLETVILESITIKDKMGYIFDFRGYLASDKTQEISGHCEFSKRDNKMTGGHLTFH